MKRRRVLAAIGGGISGAIAGCLASREESSIFSESDDVSGEITDLHGEPISDVTVSLYDPSTGTDETTDTDSEGTFSIDTHGYFYLRAEHPDYNERVRAVASGERTQLRLSQSDTVSLSFGGDVMFGRRYYETPNGDFRPRYQIDTDNLLQSHTEILEGIRPLLSASDISSVNLETPLTTSDWIHPEKSFKFTSHPIAAEALVDAGVDYVALGNNHTLDALTPGLEETIGSLNESSLAFSGAGVSSRDAWEPAIVTRNGIDIAFISCTTVIGDQYEINWSADRDTDETYTLSPSDQPAVDNTEAPLRVPGSAGVAEANVTRLQESVRTADERADIVVVQIHGGNEYEREPTSEMSELVDTAVDAGADLVVNHHPHVVGGVERRDETVVAWTLGNLVFDQEIWETLDSYILTVDVDEDGPVRTTIEPVVIQGYTPQLATRNTRQQVLRDVLSYTNHPFELHQTTIRRTDNDRTVDATSVSGAGELFEVQSGWIDSADVIDGEHRFGRDLLRFGQFENDLVDHDPVDGPLWRFGRDRANIDAEQFGYNSIELTRERHNESRVFLSPRYRIPIEQDEMTLSGQYKYDSSSGFDVVVSWYPERSGGSVEQELFSPDGTDGEWNRFAYDLSPPSGVQYVDIFIYLYPDSSDRRTLRLTDLRLIEWRDQTPNPASDHLYLDGEAELEMLSNDVAPSVTRPVNPE